MIFLQVRASEFLARRPLQLTGMIFMSRTDCLTPQDCGSSLTPKGSITDSVQSDQELNPNNGFITSPERSLSAEHARACGQLVMTALLASLLAQ
jgi:hypothetical protein